MHRSEAMLQKQGAIIQAMHSQWSSGNLHAPSNGQTQQYAAESAEKASAAIQDAMQEVLEQRLWPLEALLEQATASHGDIGEVLRALEALHDLPRAGTLTMNAIVQLLSEVEHIRGVERRRSPSLASEEESRQAETRSLAAAPTQIQGDTSGAAASEACMHDTASTSLDGMGDSMCPSSPSWATTIPDGCSNAATGQDDEESVRAVVGGPKPDNSSPAGATPNNLSSQGHWAAGVVPERKQQAQELLSQTAACSSLKLSRRDVLSQASSRFEADLPAVHSDNQMIMELGYSLPLGAAAPAEQSQPAAEDRAQHTLAKSVDMPEGSLGELRHVADGGTATKVGPTFLQAAPAQETIPAAEAPVQRTASCPQSPLEDIPRAVRAMSKAICDSKVGGILGLTLQQKASAAEQSPLSTGPLVLHTMACPHDSFIEATVNESKLRPSSGAQNAKAADARQACAVLPARAALGGSEASGPQAAASVASGTDKRPKKAGNRHECNSAAEVQHQHAQEVFSDSNMGTQSRHGHHEELEIEEQTTSRMVGIFEWPDSSSDATIREHVLEFVKNIGELEALEIGLDRWKSPCIICTFSTSHAARSAISARQLRRLNGLTPHVASWAAEDFASDHPPRSLLAPSSAAATRPEVPADKNSANHDQRDLTEHSKDELKLLNACKVAKAALLRGPPDPVEGHRDHLHAPLNNSMPTAESEPPAIKLAKRPTGRLVMNRSQTMQQPCVNQSRWDSLKCATPAALPLPLPGHSSTDNLPLIAPIQQGLHQQEVPFSVEQQPHCQPVDPTTNMLHSAASDLPISQALEPPSGPDVIVPAASSRLPGPSTASTHEALVSQPVGPQPSVKQPQISVQPDSFSMQYLPLLTQTPSSKQQASRNSGLWPSMSNWTKPLPPAMCPAPPLVQTAAEPEAKLAAKPVVASYKSLFSHCHTAQKLASLHQQALSDAVPTGQSSLESMSGDTGGPASLPHFTISPSAAIKPLAAGPRQDHQLASSLLPYSKLPLAPVSGSEPQLQPPSQDCSACDVLPALALHADQEAGQTSGQTVGPEAQPTANGFSNESNMSFKLCMAAPGSGTLLQDVGTDVQTASAMQWQADRRSRCRDADQDEASSPKRPCRGLIRADGSASAADGWRVWPPLPISAPVIPGLDTSTQPSARADVQSATAPADEVGPQHLPDHTHSICPAGKLSGGRISNLQPEELESVAAADKQAVGPSDPCVRQFAAMVHPVESQLRNQGCQGPPEQLYDRNKWQHMLQLNTSDTTNDGTGICRDMRAQEPTAVGTATDMSTITRQWALSAATPLPGPPLPMPVLPAAKFPQPPSNPWVPRRDSEIAAPWAWAPPPGPILRPYTGPPGPAMPQSICREEVPPSWPAAPNPDLTNVHAGPGGTHHMPHMSSFGFAMALPDDHTVQAGSGSHVILPSRPARGCVRQPRGSCEHGRHRTSTVRPPGLQQRVDSGPQRPKKSRGLYKSKIMMNSYAPHMPSQPGS
ncbi:hypothetical protein WJX74_003822 [Apatococcus lobatus]|uniref:Uncharacterized protein n=1 Tax=Apatococcus lobatus TaxID=904363 RepID=A0AAW1RSB1_9CHLO